MLSVFLSNLKSFEVLNALVTLPFATNGGGQGVGAWRIMGRKGEREAGEERLGSGRGSYKRAGRGKKWGNYATILNIS